MIKNVKNVFIFGNFLEKFLKNFESLIKIWKFLKVLTLSESTGGSRNETETFYLINAFISLGLSLFLTLFLILLIFEIFRGVFVSLREVSRLTPSRGITRTMWHYVTWFRVRFNHMREIILDKPAENLSFLGRNFSYLGFVLHPRNFPEFFNPRILNVGLFEQKQNLIFLIF